MDADTAKAAKPVKIPAVQVKALAALQDLLDGPDVADHAGQRAVSEQAWRDACEARAITASDKADTRARTWRRAAGDLVAAGLIGRGDGLVWVPRAGDEFDPLPPPAEGAEQGADKRTNPDGSYWVPGWCWVCHATKPAMRAPSRALPRRRALCTNWKKPR